MVLRDDYCDWCSITLMGMSTEVIGSSEALLLWEESWMVVGSGEALLLWEESWDGCWIW